MSIIEVKNVGKKYNITHQKGGYLTLRDTLTHVFKNPFKFLETKENFWALKEINFTIEKGEVVGIIGKNGAGKSTLLKILSQITPPTTGEIKINGTVGSLLEVGTGFHPELTGRENIFLNGAILGMKKKEISEKFNDIVEFSGIEKFIDTPVKYYSSGMYVRLAFSVAAHMEPDILIVDEVLAVGDAEFQKKCLGKMEEITKKDGKTILFVSHNMLAIKQLCTKSIFLSKGNIKMLGKTEDVVDVYLNDKSEKESSSLNKITSKNGEVLRFTDIEISNQDGHKIIKSSDNLKIKLGYENDSDESIIGARVVITIISESTQQIVLRLDSDIPNETIQSSLPSNGKVLCETEAINLTEGNYIVDIDFLIGGTSVSYIKGVEKFEVETDLKTYEYKSFPDSNVCNRIIKYKFK